jgi:hypothetical protein
MQRWFKQSPKPKSTLQTLVPSAPNDVSAQMVLICLVALTIHDFKNDTEQAPLALQIIAFPQTLPAS